MQLVVWGDYSDLQQLYVKFATIKNVNNLEGVASVDSNQIEWYIFTIRHMILIPLP